MAGTGDMSRSATTFDVKQLVELAWRGDIRVPRFQREFRWKWEDARKLFDSIMKNYPIGSLLLWARPAPQQTLQLGALSVEAPESASALWVVDGQQRITSMANVLHPRAGTDSRFALAYHLRNERLTKPAGNNDPLAVPLPVLFDQQQVMRWFWERPEINDYFDVASAISEKIRGYSVPAYQVEHEDERVLQDIFDRMNNYGKRLTKAEVFTALNAGDEDTGRDRLTFSAIANQIATERNFGMIDDGTVLQAVLARRHPDVQREIRNEFDVVSDDEGQDTAYQAARDALLRAANFLQEEAAVPHSALLSYRYLLVVLARYFALHPEPGTQNTRLLRRWYWRAAAVGPGVFPGGTTGATRILGQQINADDPSGSVQNLLNALGDRPNEAPVPDVRKFQANSAASKIMLCSWWECSPRDPETGDMWNAADLAECLVGKPTASEALQTIIAPEQLPEELRTSAANRVLLPVLNRDTAEVPDLMLHNIDHLADEVWESVQRSHLLTPRSAQLLEDGENAQFIRERQKLMHDTVTDFLQRHCEWDFEDTPPLGELVLEDEEADELD